MSTEKPLPLPPPSRGRHREAWVGLFVVAGIAATVILLAVLWGWPPLTGSSNNTAG